MVVDASIAAIVVPADVVGHHPPWITGSIVDIQVSLHIDPNTELFWGHTELGTSQVPVPYSVHTERTAGPAV